MLKFAKRLSQQARGQQTPPGDKNRKQSSSKDFSLRQSPLSRLLAWNVGRGHSASSFQKVAAAATSESGVNNVSKSFLPLRTAVVLYVLLRFVRFFREDLFCLIVNRKEHNCYKA